jgi:hypothetical protein
MKFSDLESEILEIFQKILYHKDSRVSLSRGKQENSKRA